MKISRKSKKLVDQVYDRYRGWREITPLPLRRLWWKDKQKIMRHVDAIHIVEYGDYLIRELK